MNVIYCVSAVSIHKMLLLSAKFFFHMPKKYYYCPLNFKDSKNVWLER